MQHGLLKWRGCFDILIQLESSMTRAMNFREWTFKFCCNNMASKMFQHQFKTHRQMLCVVVGNNLQTLLHSNPPANLNDARTMVEYCLATASYLLHCAASRALGVSPGAVVFYHDMLIDVPYVANLLLLCEKRQAVIDDNL
jgi:hypothetical protein